MTSRLRDVDFVSMAILAICSLTLGCQPQISVSDVPVYEITAWPVYDGLVLFRSEGSDSRRHLITHQFFEDYAAEIREGNEMVGTGHGDVFRYDPELESLVQIDNEAWEGQVTPIARDQEQTNSFGSFQILPRNDANSQLYLGERQIPVVGGTALELAVSPQGDYIAVLSTSGRAPVNIFFIYGGAALPGQRYHQLFSVESGERIGSAVRLQWVGQSRNELRINWTADGEYVVYIEEDDLPIRYVSFIPAGNAIREARHR